jgi:hypothetical protein
MSNLSKLLNEAKRQEANAVNAHVSNFAEMNNISLADASSILRQGQAMSMPSKGLPTVTKQGYTPGVNANGTSVGTIAITVTRDAANIAETLFAPIGGTNAKASQYRRQLSQRNASYVGMTGGLTALTAAAAANQVFTFTDGGTDVLTVAASGEDYSSILESLSTSIYSIAKTRISVSAAASAGAVFANDIEIDVSWATGADKSNSLPVTASFSPYQDQSSILDVEAQFTLSPDTTLLVPIPAVAGLSVTYTFFIDRIDRIS